MIDDTPKPPEKRYSTKYPGLVQLSWEDSERVVRQAESGRNPRRDVHPNNGPTALQRRMQAIGEYHPPRPAGWIHRVPPRQTQRHADWGIVLGASVLFGGAVLILIFLGSYGA